MADKDKKRRSSSSAPQQPHPPGGATGETPPVPKAKGLWGKLTKFVGTLVDASSSTAIGDEEERQAIKEMDVPAQQQHDGKRRRSTIGEIIEAPKPKKPDYRKVASTPVLTRQDGTVLEESSSGSSSSGSSGSSESLSGGSVAEEQHLQPMTQAQPQDQQQQQPQARTSAAGTSENLNLIRESLVPAHFSSKMTQDEDIRRSHKANRKRRISQLYKGDVYHHALTSVWDVPGNPTRFQEILDEETRAKYIITIDVAAKLDEIKRRKVDKERRRTLAMTKAPIGLNKVSKGCRAWFIRQVKKSSLAYVFKVTPRYYKMTPDVPKACRRCKYPTEDTLERRWTPVGVMFCFLFPIFGTLCCLANREWVCVVCEEVYVYGDYPSRCRPADHHGEKARNVALKRRSFDKVGGWEDMLGA